MKTTSFFVAGTDTGVGKTFTACALLLAAKQQGLSTAAVKPLAAGCEVTPEGLRNDDALQLQQAMTQPLSYEQVNPIALAPAIAPHIAAAKVGKQLNAARLAGFCRGVMMKPCDLVLIEGAGGWRVPINRHETMANLACELRLNVILVVGMRIGCLNHALLTAAAIVDDGLEIAGWVANCAEGEMASYQENLETLYQRLPFPCLGAVPYLEGGTSQQRLEQGADCLDIQKLLQ